MGDLRHETREQLVARIADLTSKLELARALLGNLEEVYRVLEEQGIPDAQAEAAAAVLSDLRKEVEGLRGARVFGVPMGYAATITTDPELVKRAAVLALIDKRLEAPP